MQDIDKESLIEKIVTGIIDFKIIPFIGAGLSIPFGLKSWDDLIAILKLEIVTNETDFLKVAQFYENSLGRDKLLEKLKEQYDIPDFTKFDTSLHELILAMAPPIIYTTNYDTAIENTAKYSNMSYFKIACLRDIVTCPHKSNVIVKFHGDFSSPEEIVLTDNDYSKRLELENPLDVRFRSDLIGKGLLFIGYSLRDININYVLEKHVNQYGSNNIPKNYIIVLEENITEDLASNFGSKNVEIVPISSYLQLMDLIKLINLNAYQGTIKNQISNIFKSNPGKVLLKNELENLRICFRDSKYTDVEKSKKIIDSIAYRNIPDGISSELLEFFKEVIYADEYIKSKEAAIISFSHLRMRTSVYAEIAIELMELTVYDELNWGNQINFSLTDVISSIEMVLGRELAVEIIFLFLDKCMEEGRILKFEQADRIFYSLNRYKYQDFIEKNQVIPKELKGQLIEHFLKQQPQVIRNKFNSPLFLQRPTGSETIKYFLDNFEKS